MVACCRRLSSVLKHKKPPKRGGGRKSSKSDPVASSSSESIESYSPMADSYAGLGRGSMAVELTPPPPRGKWSSGGKSSFLAGFHPSRWGRASSTGPERPAPHAVSLDVLFSNLMCDPCFSTGCIYSYCSAIAHVKLFQCLFSYAFFILSTYRLLHYTIFCSLQGLTST